MLNTKPRYNDLNVDVFSYKNNDIWFNAAGKYDIHPDSNFEIIMLVSVQWILSYDIMTYSPKKWRRSTNKTVTNACCLYDSCSTFCAFQIENPRLMNWHRLTFALGFRGSECFISLFLGQEIIGAIIAVERLFF